MRNLVLSALALAGLTQATGCIIGGDDPEGTFELQWQLEDAAMNPLTCAQADVDEIELLVTDEGGQGIADQWPCEDGAGETYGLSPGIYTVMVNALRDDVAVALGDVFEGEQVFDGEVTDLGLFTVVMDVEPQLVTVDFTVDYGAAGGDNCTETAAGGSGVVQQQINIYDVGQATCLEIPYTAELDPAAETCTPTICQENTFVQSIQLAPGTYDIEIWGLKGAVAAETVICYSFAAEIGVSSDDTVDFVVPFEPINDPDDACNATKPSRGGR